MSQASEQSAEERPLTEGQRRKLMALLRQAGVEDRGARLERLSGLVGRKLISSTDMSRDEAKRAIDLLVVEAAGAGPGGAS